MTCANCGQAVEFHLAYCRACGAFAGYPNVRKATAMRADLTRHYAEAVADADARSVRPLLDRLENLLSSSVPVIAMRPNTLLTMTLGTAYRNYHRAYGEALRPIAEETYHRHRGVVDAAIHPGYFAEITDAAVSTDGRGLNNYGPITLRIGDRFIADRATVLRENAFEFYKRYNLGERDAAEEPGWRCVWPQRAELGVAHLASQLTPSVPEASLPALVLSSGADRDSDRFLEVHIYGMVPIETIEQIALDRPLTTSDAQDDWDLARRKIVARGIPDQDRTTP